MELKSLFEEAVVNSRKLTVRPDNDTLLQLYSLYKQATEGDNNTEPPTNMFDFVSKAKHDAWTGLRGKSKEWAMESYITLVNKLGSK